MKVVMYAPAGRMTALATRYEVRTQVASSWLAPRPPAMCGRATLAIEVSSTSMKVARVTVIATIQGLTRGRHGRSITGAARLKPEADASSICIVAVAIHQLRFYRLGGRFTEFAWVSNKVRGVGAVLQ